MPEIRPREKATHLGRSSDSRPIPHSRNIPITKIISGELELAIEGKIYHLEAGSAAVIPPRAVHSAQAITP